MSKQPRPTITFFFICLAILLLPAVAMAAPNPYTGDGGMGSLSQAGQLFLSSVDSTFTSIASILAGNTFLGIFAACVALRILAIVIPAMADSNGSSFGPEIVKLILTVAIITTMAQEWAGGSFNIYQHIWSGTDDLLQQVINATTGTKPSIPASGNPLPAIGTWLINSCVSNIVASYNSMTAFLSPPGGESFWQWAEAFFTANNGAALLVILVMLITVLLVAAIYCLILLEFIQSWAHIGIAMTFGPLVLAFYPIKPDWGKTLLTEVASGIMTFLATAAIVVVSNNYINSATQALDTIANEYSAGTLKNSSTGGIVVALGVYVFMILLIGLSTKTVSKVAAALVGGRDHFSAMRGVGAAIGAIAAGKVMGAIANAGAKGAGTVAGAAGGAAAKGATAAAGGIRNLATGHTAGALASIRSQRSARDSATKASNQARNSGTPNVGGGNGSSGGWTLS